MGGLLLLSSGTWSSARVCSLFCIHKCSLFPCPLHKWLSRENNRDTSMESFYIRLHSRRNVFWLHQGFSEIKTTPYNSIIMKTPSYSALGSFEAFLPTCPFTHLARFCLYIETLGVILISRLDIRIIPPA